MYTRTFSEELKKAFDEGYDFAVYELTQKGLILNEYNKLDSEGSNEGGDKTNTSTVDL
jgi:hypothetical protein